MSRHLFNNGKKKHACRAHARWTFAKLSNFAPCRKFKANYFHWGAKDCNTRHAYCVLTKKHEYRHIDYHLISVGHSYVRHSKTRHNWTEITQGKVCTRNTLSYCIIRRTATKMCNKDDRQKQRIWQLHDVKAILKRWKHVLYLAQWRPSPFPNTANCNMKDRVSQHKRRSFTPS